MKKFSYKERTAISVENGKIELWSTEGAGRSKTFRNSKGAAILKSDDGCWWEQFKKDAEYCNFAQYWMGEFPYSSWCFALRVCKITGEAEFTAIETEINPKGMTDSDRWVAECKSYVPEEIAEGKPAVSAA